MLWSKQFYHYIVEQWLEGDPAMPPPPQERKHERNSQWRHLYNERVMSMPDKWEFPWYASWDLAFHCIPLALVDPNFAKSQLDLIVRQDIDDKVRALLKGRQALRIERGAPQH